jgi:hypothetical protein
MILFENKMFFPYILWTDQGPVLGLDERTPDKVEAEWLEKVKRSAEREAQQSRAAIRANIENELLAKKKVDDHDPILSEHGVGSGVALGEVASPPAEVLEKDEVLRLSGLPSGHGYASVFASEVSGVCIAWGDAADDLCDLPPVREFKTKKIKAKKKPGGRA